MLLAESVVNDTSIQAAIITTIGVIAVSLIGVLTAKITSNARKEATHSADVVKDYVAALEAKDALVNALEQRVSFLEAQNKGMEERIADLKAEVNALRAER